MHFCCAPGSQGPMPLVGNGPSYSIRTRPINLPSEAIGLHPGPLGIAQSTDLTNLTHIRLAELVKRVTQARRSLPACRRAPTWIGPTVSAFVFTKLLGMDNVSMLP